MGMATVVALPPIKAVKSTIFFTDNRHIQSCCSIAEATTWRQSVKAQKKEAQCKLDFINSKTSHCSVQRRQHVLNQRILYSHI